MDESQSEKSPQFASQADFDLLSAAIKVRFDTTDAKLTRMEKAMDRKLAKLLRVQSASLELLQTMDTRLKGMKTYERRIGRLENAVFSTGKPKRFSV